MTPATRSDLHVHSWYSDGTHSPPAIVEEAREAGLGAIALTDHDSVDGVLEAQQASAELGPLVIAGVELSVGLEREEIHLLGYGVDPKNRNLQEALQLLAAERERRMRRMVRALAELGVEAHVEDVLALARRGVVSRLHLATYLAEKGIVAEREEAFERYIGNGRPAYVRRSLFSLRKAVDLIRGSGGFAVLAHPGLTRRDDLIPYLVRIGVRGLEVFYPRHSVGDVSRYLKYCRKFELFAVGGSDYHGTNKPETSLGAASTPPAMLEQILENIPR